jgi:hypothetical protein
MGPGAAGELMVSRKTREGRHCEKNKSFSRTPEASQTPAIVLAFWCERVDGIFSRAT